MLGIVSPVEYGICLGFFLHDSNHRADTFFVIKDPGKFINQSGKWWHPWDGSYMGIVVSHYKNPVINQSV